MTLLYELRREVLRIVAAYEEVKRENVWLRSELAKVRAMSLSSVRQ